MARENLCMRLLRTAHFGPTLVVTLAGYLLSRSVTSDTRALMIALAIFLGQLSVGWTNDLADRETDHSQGRKNKPLATGEISVRTVVAATICALTLCVPLSLFGPLGLRGGSLHLIGVGSGLAYNFFFKKTLLSPLPYVVAFAAMPSAIVLSERDTVPIWLILTGGIFGIAAHFSNVIKDMDQDRASGIIGLPQLLGSRASLIISAIAFLTISILLSANTHFWLPVPISIFAVLLLLISPTRFSFPIVMALALIDVTLLVSKVSL